jgi:hypothetical protein
MGTDDLLCSRNARPQKDLVGRAQWKINQPPSLKREQASLEGAFRWMMAARCAHLRIDQATLVKISRDGADARSWRPSSKPQGRKLGRSGTTPQVRPAKARVLRWPHFRSCGTIAPTKRGNSDEE